jgi:hypothetical protein
VQSKASIIEHYLLCAINWVTKTLILKETNPC